MSRGVMARSSDRPGDSALPGHLMGLFVAFSFGSAYPIGKPLVDAVDPLAMSAARYLLAGALLLVVLRLLGHAVAIRRSDVPSLAGLGLLGFTIFQGGWGLALEMTSPGKAVVLVATTPIFGAILGVLAGEWLSTRGWLGIGLAFAGVFAVVNDGVTAMNLGGGSFVGDALFVGIAAVWALFGMAARRTIVRLGAWRTAAWSMLFGSILLVPFGLPGALTQEWAAVDPGLALNFLWISIVIGCIGMAAWNGGLVRLGLARMTVYLYVSPVFGITLSGLMLGEWLTLAQAGGAAAVVAGVAITQTAARRARRNIRHVE